MKIKNNNLVNNYKINRKNKYKKNKLNNLIMKVQIINKIIQLMKNEHFYFD